MRTRNLELERKIRDKALELLMIKEPEEIGMRDIAAAAGVTATAIYYYYEDKERLLEAVKKDCMATMDAFIASRMGDLSGSLGTLRGGLAAFRDWAFANPRIALLVMNRFTPNVNAGPEEMAEYYRSTFFARDCIAREVAAGNALSDDPLLDASLAISAMWGAIESILRFRTVPEYWERGVEFTDAMIDVCCARLARGGRGK